MKNETSTQHKAPAPKIPRKITESYLHNAGLYYLGRFSSSSGNFRQVMLRKIHKSCTAHPDQSLETCREQLETLIEKFQTLDLLNDQTYARSKVTTLRRRGKSTRDITAQLMSKDISRNAIQTALDLYQKEHSPQRQGEDGDIEAANIFARKKKIGPFRGKKEENTQKELATLARAGFSYEIAQKVIFRNDLRKD